MYLFIVRRNRKYFFIIKIINNKQYNVINCFYSVQSEIQFKQTIIKSILNATPTSPPPHVILINEAKVTQWSRVITYL